MKNHANQTQCPTCGGKGRIKRDAPRWHKIVDLFDGKAKKIMTVGGHGILVRGMLYSLEMTKDKDGHLQQGEPELAVCSVPQAIGGRYSAELGMLATANLVARPLILSDNIHLCKLEPITDEEAEEILEFVEGEEVSTS